MTARRLAAVWLTALAAGIIVAFSEVRTAQGLSVVALLAVLWGLNALLGARLGQGSMVYVDTAMALSSVVLFSSTVVVSSFLVGAGAGILLNGRDQSSLGYRLAQVARKSILVLAVAPLGALVRGQASGQLDTLSLQAALVGLGLLYAIADLLTDALAESVRNRTSVADEFIRLARPVVAIYMGHVSTGAVIVLLFPTMGYVGLVAMMALVLMMQNSFNLLLRIRTAYHETVSALVLAAEMQTPSESGHAKRVADLATAVGRRLGFRSSELERLGYAALLHDIGRIGTESDGDAAQQSHAQVGADIVEQIPFVSSAAPIVRAHELDAEVLFGMADSNIAVAALLVKVASRLDCMLRSAPDIKPAELLESEVFSDMRQGAAGSRILRQFVQVSDDWTPECIRPSCEES